MKSIIGTIAFTLFCVSCIAQTAFKYDQVGAFNEGLARIKQDGKWGYLDATGKEVIPFEYDDAGSFSEGLAPVMKRKKWGYIDKSGRVVIDLHYDGAGGF